MKVNNTFLKILCLMLSSTFTLVNHAAFQYEVESGEVGEVGEVSVAEEIKEQFTLVR